MSKVEEVLRRVESGETTAHDAAWLREQFALQAIGRVVDRDGQPSIQGRVLQDLASRGIRDGWNDGQFVARLVLQLQVNLAGLVRCVDYPMVGPRAAQIRIEEMGQAILDRIEEWDGFGIDLDMSAGVIGRYLANLLVPVLAIAELIGIDVLAAVSERFTQAERVAVGGGNGHGGRA